MHSGMKSPRGSERPELVVLLGAMRGDRGGNHNNLDASQDRLDAKHGHCRHTQALTYTCNVFGLEILHGQPLNALAYA